MAQRKLQQEVDRCFKKVGEGIQAFEAIFEKIQQTSNSSQKEKLEDALKREIKKLQRQRDQIKSWAASNEIKDKKPLLEQRKLIETQMEKFKAVEKEMKTKAYSKEGLSAAAKLDPKEKEKLEACQFLSNMVEDLERQIETSEAELESLQATVKKGRKDTGKASRLADIEERTERHKWHQGKLELILRALENGSLETEHVVDLQESIKYYVESNGDADFMEDDSIYDDLNLNEEEEAFGMGNENDHVSSQDTQSIQDDAPDTEARTSVAPTGKTKPLQPSEAMGPAARRPSNHAKSPLPALATLHNPLSNVTNTTTNNQMKPAPLPTRGPGETLKYASAAAAAAAGDKTLGIAPLPPPPGASNSPSSAVVGLAPLPAVPTARTSNASSPSVSNAGLASGHPLTISKPSWSASASTGESISRSETQSQSPAQSHSHLVTNLSQVGAAPGASIMESTSTGAQGNLKAPASSTEKTSSANDSSNRTLAKDVVPLKDLPQAPRQLLDNAHLNGDSSSTRDLPADADESVYHLPPGLQDLIQSFEATKSRVSQPQNAAVQRLLAASHSTCPDASDAEKPRHFKPQTRYNTPAHYPQEAPAVFDDPRLYSRIDTDTLFYVFYYRQNTYQQYLAAKALKSQSWRFHKQYQTWFQRHEEPKTITEEFEQGTYRFFDYESTWMNRRKPDFQFAYKFLEDEL